MRPTASDGGRPHRLRRGTAERREEILRAAIRTFGSKGYHNGSLTEVAEQVGMTHAGVLHHFGSKNQLLIATLQFRDRVDVEHLEGKHIPGGRDLFRHLVKTAEINAERRGIVQAYAVLTGESVTEGHPASGWARGRFATLRREIADALRELISEVTDNPVDDDLVDGVVTRAASAIIGVMDGLQSQWLLDPGALDLAESTAFAIDAIVARTVATATTPLTPPY
ncbi:TetR/AcrR family transcriptional regulator [Pseudonocardia sp. TRM90224]|uniref:TetR/AcrR family transcriptional regulator n=1 Tax=Pseudonocardia sp. TRM90224 TaxID=2812678 RepID=UPI001E6222D4|nr:TetR/AcrR family transcriptional regulator [Pseudonocardia sp. TRM90224]